MTNKNEYVCPVCCGTGEIEVKEECLACMGTGLVNEKEAYRQSLIALAGILAQRAVAMQLDTAAKLLALQIEGERYEMNVETHIKVKEMETQGHFESDLWKLRHDLVETLFDRLAVPQPKRCDKSTQVDTQRDCVTEKQEND